MEKVNHTVTTNPTRHGNNIPSQNVAKNISQNSLFASNNIYTSEVLSQEFTENLFSILETSIENAKTKMALAPDPQIFGSNPWMGTMDNPFMMDMMPNFEIPVTPTPAKKAKSTASTPEAKKETAQDEKTKVDAKPKAVVADGTATTAKQQLVKKAEQAKEHPTKKEQPKLNYNEMIEKIAKEEGVDHKLLKAMMHQESGGNHRALSHKGAGGLMQLMPATAKAMGVKNRFDPEQNIRGGAKYLAQQLKRHNGNVELALASYNAGPNAVKKHGGVPPFKETQNYVAKIMAKYQS